ncbi:hypothetical protein PORY_002012 [Pneumocystis oryctolagi]|uniref:Uncharacterized protein n=1 Tax=Pneumocystis oryctolagi TaxID=42067 RepID=A0ACB7CCN8_9ASCO|nr:hypothetical protein PORY_002012 [Pneumocystis oryctolagi]
MKRLRNEYKNDKLRNRVLFDFWERKEENLNLHDNFQNLNEYLKSENYNSNFSKNSFENKAKNNELFFTSKNLFPLKNISFHDCEMQNLIASNNEYNKENFLNLNNQNGNSSDKFVCSLCFHCFIKLEEFNVHINDCLKTKKNNLEYYNNADKNTAFISEGFNINENYLNKRIKTKVFKDRILKKKKEKLTKVCPFYKIMLHTGFSVDAFEFGKIEGCIGYFLSHFHSDHYKGLNSNWDNGLIYCSKITGNLIISQLKVNPAYVIKLPMNKEILLNNVRVTLVDANHCPGSVMFVFEMVKSGKTIRYLHSGDFRACPSQVYHPAIKNKHFDFLYLDTTYFDPKYSFPSQEMVISAVTELCRILNRDSLDNDFFKKKRSLNLDNFLITTSTMHENKHRVLIAIGTYIVGKEKLAFEIACSLKSKIYADQNKQKIIACLEDKNLQSLLTNDPKEAFVHLVNFKNMSVETLHQYLIKQKPYFSKIVGFKATGRSYASKSYFINFSNIHTMIKNWKIDYDYTMMKPNKDSTSVSMCYSIPYSEHSSFKELICFCLSINVKKILPTVNIHTKKSIDSMEKWFNLLEDQKKKCGLLSLLPDQMW